MSTLASPVIPSTSKAIHYGLWGSQLLLAVAFAVAGLMKATMPLADLALKMAWVPSTPEALVRFIGVSELFGAAGLLLPAATRIQPWLTALAAAALTLVMVLAAGVHLSLGEYGGVVTNVALGGLAAFVAWGRTKKAPIAPR